MEERKTFPAPREVHVSGIDASPIWMSPKVHTRIAIRITKHRHRSSQ